MTEGFLRWLLPSGNEKFGTVSFCHGNILLRDYDNAINHAIGTPAQLNDAACALLANDQLATESRDKAEQLLTMAVRGGSIWGRYNLAMLQALADMKLGVALLECLAAKLDTPSVVKEAATLAANMIRASEQKDTPPEAYDTLCKTAWEASHNRIGLLYVLYQVRFAYSHIHDLSFVFFCGM